LSLGVRWAGLAFMVASLAFLSAILWRFLPYGHVRPVAYSEVRALTPEVEQGGDLELALTVDKDRQCRAAIRSYARSADDGALRLLNNDEVPIAPLGHTELAFAAQLPDRMPPGDYFWFAVSEYDCTEQTYITRTPEVLFKVIARSRPAAPQSQ
jgi:hypothetical protein